MRRIRHLRLHACGMAVDLDARRVTVADGAVVDTWPAGLGTSINATASGSSRPTYRVNQINGRPALQFDGSDDIMSMSSGALALTNNVGSYYAVLVGNSSASGDAAQNGLLVSHGGSATGSRASMQLRNTTNIFRSVARRLDGDSTTNSSSLSGTASPCICQQIVNYTAGTHRAGLNGVDTADAALSSSGNTSATNSLAVSIGAASYSSNRLTGFIGYITSGSVIPGAVVRRRIRAKFSRTFRIPTT